MAASLEPSLELCECDKKQITYIDEQYTKMKKVLFTMLGALALLSGAKAQTPGSDLPNLKQLFELTDSIDVNLRANFSPLIGLSASISNNGYSQVSATYINAIVKQVERP